MSFGKKIFPVYTVEMRSRSEPDTVVGVYTASNKARAAMKTLDNGERQFRITKFFSVNWGADMDYEAFYKQTWVNARTAASSPNLHIFQEEEILKGMQTPRIQILHDFGDQI